VLDLLGRDIGQRPHDLGGGRGRGLARDRPGKAEVGDLDHPVVADDDVLGLDVAMHQAGLMGRGERIENGIDDVEGGAGSHGPAGSDDLPEGAPGDIFERQEHHAVVLDVVEDGHDIGVGEIPARLRFALEPGDEPLVAGQVGPHDFEGDRAVEPGVPTPVNARHPAPGDALLDQVPAAEERADQRIGGVDGHPAKSTGGAWRLRSATRVGQV
jgi:hypothetical protein